MSGRWILPLLLSTAPSLGRALPRSEPAPAVRACPEAGEGFVRLPGADTCVKLGGMVRVEGMRRSGTGGGTSGDR